MDAKGESAAMEQNVHDGHRLRVKQRFLAEGLEHFEPHQVLEMLLFYVIPRKDTNELAHQLIRTFGSLSQVLEAPYEELARVKGMSANAAVLVSFCGQLLRAIIRISFPPVRFCTPQRKRGTSCCHIFSGGEMKQWC